jgi:LysR family hca operon transcriptional activator
VLASHESIRLKDLAGETFIGVSATAPTLRSIIESFIRKERVDLAADHEADNLAMAISLVSSTRGVALLPAYAQNFLPWSVVSRPLKAEAPTIDLVVGHRKDNASALLKLFLSGVEEMIAGVSRKRGPA